MKYKTWTESAVLQGFNPDGKTGFVVRAQHCPGTGRDWLWMSIFTPQRIYGFVEEHLQAGRSVTRVDAPDVVYRVGNQEAQGAGVLQREGPRDAPVGAFVFALGRGHEGPRMREGVGEEELSLSGALTRQHAPGSSVPDRAEMFGSVVGRLSFRKKTVPVEGFGHWHEHHSFEPRFSEPFTYLSLAGADGGLIAVRTPGGSGGFISRGDETAKITGFEIDPAAEQRRVVVTTDDGRSIEFTATDAHRYSLPIERKRRESSVVTATVDGSAMVGVIDDWDVEGVAAEIG